MSRYLQVSENEIWLENVLVGSVAPGLAPSAYDDVVRLISASAIHEDEEKWHLESVKNLEGQIDALEEQIESLKDQIVALETASAVTIAGPMPDFMAL